MQPWRDCGRTRPRATVLPAQPRHSGRRSTLDPGAGLSGRGTRSRYERHRAGTAGRRRLRLVGRPGRMNVEKIRQDFPILSQTIRGKPLVFLDSAASAQKPRAVIDAMRNAMETQYANVHRGLHWMSERTTDAYESARDAVAGMLNAADRDEVVITRNVTESLN